jgi:hypothetical protein
MDEEIGAVASLHRIEQAALVHLKGKDDQAIHRRSSSDGSVFSEANTTPCSPQSGLNVQGPCLGLEANSKDEPSFSETVETLKADAAAQECVVELFSRVLDRCITVGISRAHACASTALLARVRGGKRLPTVVRRAIGDCFLSLPPPPLAPRWTS